MCLHFVSGTAGILRQRDQPEKVESHTFRSRKMVFGLDAIPGRESGIGHIRNDIGFGSSISDQQLGRSNTHGSGSNGLPHRPLRRPVHGQDYDGLLVKSPFREISRVS